jgi:ATP-dependent 26S proteasome regulatory subunit
VLEVIINAMIYSFVAATVAYTGVIINWALQKSERGDGEGGFIKSPLTLKDLTLTVEVKQKIQVLLQCERARAKSNLSNNLYLFSGSPGTGKSSLALAIAGELKRPIYRVSGSSLRSRYAGFTVWNIKDLFKNVKKTGTQCIIFIDEIDSIAASRTDDGTANGKEWNSMLLQLIEEMDNLPQDGSILFCAATNCRLSLDDAVLRRFSTEIVMPLLGEREITLLLKSYLTDKVEKVEEAIEKLCPQDLKGVSGGEIKTLVTEAGKKERSKRGDSEGNAGVDFIDIKISEESLLSAKQEILQRLNKNSTFSFSFATAKLENLILSQTEENEIKQVVSSIKDLQKLQNMGVESMKGFLFYGLPGTGKTSVALAIAGETKRKICIVKRSELSLSSIEALFNKVKENSPCILFVDEFDSFGQARQSGSSNVIVNQLLKEIDECRRAKIDVTLIGTTNHVEWLDKAMIRPGRIDKCILFALPDEKTAKRIFEFYLTPVKKEGSDLEKSIDSKTLKGLSGSEIKQIVNLAGLKAVMDGREGVKLSDLETAIEETRQEKTAKESKEVKAIRLRTRKIVKNTSIADLRNNRSYYSHSNSTTFNKAKQARRVS